MKQNSGGRGMGDSEMDPSELWCQLGLLVIESREPDESSKGWREGPHCGANQIKLSHHCSPSANPLCKRKDAITREIRSLGKNNVPVCIEVVLLPQCDKHDHKLDISHGIIKGQYILLEQWKFQVLPKRSGELSVEISSLFQAVKSYLYFSQLSAWLNQTHGTAPKAVEYRVSPPAEFCTSTFQEPPELHRFPLCTQQHYTIQVTVAALPRQSKLLCLPCPDSVSVTASASAQRRRISSPVTEGACAGARSSPCSSLSPRSGSPNLACCSSYVNYPDAKWREEGGDGVMVQQLYEHREMPRSKTYKDFHSDDSSDCSECSTVTKSQTTPSPLTLSSQRIFPSSPSIQSFVEKTASPKFYLSYAQPSIERISSPSSSSDSSQNGTKDAIYSSHRPSPPIDYTPSRDVTDSLSRKLATKLSFEPLPAFELEAHVSKSVQIDVPSAMKSKSAEQSSDFYSDTAKESDSFSLEMVARQKDRSYSHTEVGYRTETFLKLDKNNASTGNECSNGALDYASNSQGISNGSTQPSFTNGTIPHSDSTPDSGGAVQNGATETNGFYSAEKDAMRHRFEVPKTPEKPLKSIMTKHLQNIHAKQGAAGKSRVPSEEERNTFRKALCKSSAAVFSKSTGLPLQSSPAPIKRLGRTSFDFDDNLTCAKAIKNSLSCVNLEEYKTTSNDEEEIEKSRKQRMYSTSAPASTNSLLGNFEESLLNGRIEPCGAVEGFCVDIGASGSFCPSHVTLPVTAFFFKLSEDNAPSPYLGHVNLESVGKRGYHVPTKGTIQVTLFNPNKTVVKMFVLTYDLTDMPPNCTTFLRQRTLYKPVTGSKSDTSDAPHYLRYLIHIRVASSKSKKLYLHSDIRMIFARDKFEYDSRIANYEYRSLTEGPVNPKYSPKK